MLSSLSLPVLILIFLTAAAVVWIAGIQLSNATDIFSVRFGLGEALGGLLFLAIATNLPEIAITSTAALRQNIGIATGNILGGIAIQTVVLVVLDVFGVRGRRSLSYWAASLDLVLEMSGGDIAGRVGMDGVLFGSTFLAAATALPEVSTGLAAVKLGDYKLAVSDIFGGNAFLPVLFLLASLLSGQAALPQAQSTDIYLTGLGSLLTAIYLYGLIFRPSRRILRMGIDSLLVLILYAIGIVGLIAVAYR